MVLKKLKNLILKEFDATEIMELFVISDNNPDAIWEMLGQLAQQKNPQEFVVSEVNNK